MSDFINPPCPFLPEIDRVIRAREVLAMGRSRGPEFYETSLSYGQSQWQLGLPAQALLQVNKALSTVLTLDEPVMQRWPLPYRVAVWLLVKSPEGQFTGNARRHFQHLATRMVEPNKELRVWRAWACWYLSKIVLSEDKFPADTKQIREEGIVEPTFEEIAGHLRRLSPANDEAMWLDAVEWSKPWHLQTVGAAAAAVIDPILADRLSKVRDLAHAIWPLVYPGIISPEQIQYMLMQRYDLTVLQDEVEAKGVCYALIRSGDEDVGYVAFEPRIDEGEAFLHKLYVLPQVAGKGLGAQALRWVTQQARERGLQRLRLCVNKHNAGAIRAYLRSGFVFHEDKVTGIGNGFVMDDYVMVKTLS